MTSDLDTWCAGSSRSSLNVKVISQSSWSHEENVPFLLTVVCTLWIHVTMQHIFGCLSHSIKVIGATSNEGSLV